MPLESKALQTGSKEPAGCRRYKGRSRSGGPKPLFAATCLLQLQRHFLSETSGVRAEKKQNTNGQQLCSMVTLY